MKFERITLENFRQYFGRQRLEFAKDSKRKVTIIHGANGAGKTSLFLAINWCLYGSDYINNVGELISKEAISRASTSDYIEMSVEISFMHDGERYIVKRLRRDIKMIDGSTYSDEEDEFTMGLMHGDGQYERIKNPIVTINAILPANVRTYFLFDGEKINDFAKPESAKQVKEAIYLVFKLETLDRGRKHLEAVASDYRKELKKTSSSELRMLVLKDEKARSDLSQNEQRKIEVIEAKDSVLQKINDIDQQLRDSQHTRSLQQKRDFVERELKQRRLDLDNVTNQIRDVSTAAHFSLAMPVINESLAILDGKRERGEIPSNVRQQFIQDLLSQMKCICGRPFTEDSAEHSRLLSLIQNKLPDSLGDDVLEISATLRGFENHKNAQLLAIKQHMQRRAFILDQIKDLEAENSDLRYQLKDSPLEEVRNLEKQRQDFLADRDSYSNELGAISERINKLHEDIAFLEKELVKVRKNEMKEKLLSAKLYLTQQAADEIKDRHQAYANDMRLKIEAKTRDIFQRLIWKDSTFEVYLDENFNLEVFDRYSKQARPELSAGERQVLSLSFITAMSRVSEEEAPLVMDTPFGRLSAKPRSNITANLPALADQLVLLVTDEELHGEARANLNPYIGAEYYLVFDTTTNYTKIMDR
jgi:DNA sulfur modification protein DndD